MLVSNKQLDIKWYTEDPDSYEAEQARIENERKRQVKEHMGSEFKKPPLLTKSELCEEIRHHNRVIESLERLEAPDNILKSAQEHLKFLMNKLSKNNYIVDEVDAKYRFAYDTRAQSFRLNTTRNIPEWVLKLESELVTEKDNYSSEYEELLDESGPENTDGSEEPWRYLLPQQNL